MPSPEDAIAEFKRALGDLDDQCILDRFYYGRPAAKLEPDQDPALRRAVSIGLGVAMRDVLITGSAKLGFTTVPKPKKNRPIFSLFGDTSDVDVAIISQELFLKFWRRTLEFASSDPEWREIGEFRKYLSRGWIRPDKLPSSPEFPEKAEWFDFFQGLTSSGLYGRYSINGGIYYDERFWEQYATKALAHCRHEVENEL